METAGLIEGEQFTTTASCVPFFRYVLPHGSIYHDDYEDSPFFVFLHHDFRVFWSKLWSFVGPRMGFLILHWGHLWRGCVVTRPTLFYCIPSSLDTYISRLRRSILKLGLLYSILRDIELCFRLHENLERGENGRDLAALWYSRVTRESLLSDDDLYEC